MGLNRIKRWLSVAMVSLLMGCTGLPEGVEPVESFELDRYLGTWYEIARLDHSFERGMERVTAEYQMRPDGGVRVLNRGFDTEQGDWQEAEGRAYFVGSDEVGHLKVSFFGPFFGSYVVFDLEPEYQYAFVAGNSTDYLWLLARTPQVSASVRQRFIEQAAARGFDTDALIWVAQE
ncbi:apolipoprotein D and lipocalin family protein [Ferrimonas marina]|uniref:Outer membrane lipoprotein Blc n=1 Tax=Ferrimonas marina TaxID=299255 RepID=A0A1M5Z462_9GAMM|nr:lipocalin family protein [Ferrimonas marina]SHI19010.1 apolipoprotein D and lipocalin family protein [Ferrimonas marina]